VWSTLALVLHPHRLASQLRDRDRLAELVPSVGVAPPPTSARLLGGSYRLIGPDVRLIWNSDIPYSLNDGALWAGRGLNSSVTFGAGAYYQRSNVGVDVVLAPSFVYSQNRPFDIFPGRDPGRSQYSSPWHLGGASADLPLRFGDRPVRRIDGGESRIEVRYRAAALGATTANEWWGPGIRNALVLSNNAPGIPRVYLRTARPVQTRIGDFNAELLAGTLTKSPFFDTLAASNYRSLSGLLLSFRPRADSGLTFGLARTVYVPASRAVPSVGASMKAFSWRPDAFSGDTVGADQITSLFARWLFPVAGFEVYGEWARMELPRSFAELAETPYDTQGYTLGFQWALPQARPGHVFRLQSELSYLEQSIVNPARPPVDFYAGRVASQGYTQRGQIIGAAIGPGGSSQWIAGDYFVPRWQLGLFVGRIRWEDNALYRQPFATFFSHDVTILSGVRGGVRLPNVDMSSELTVARRLNYLFQNGMSNPLGVGTVRIQNVTLALRFIPR
jgi:hypothetical protein